MTQIFTLNIGSSTVKLDLFDDSRKKLKSESYYHENQWEKLKSKIENFLNQHDLSNIVTAHRVVHGGQYFKTGTAINQETQDKIKELIPLDPLHQQSQRHRNLPKHWYPKPICMLRHSCL